MIKFYKIGQGLFIGILLVLLGISGCRTAPEAVPQKTPPPAVPKGASASDSQRAAETAFREMDNPQSSTAASEPVPPQKPTAPPIRQEKTEKPREQTPKEFSEKRQDWMDGISRTYPATKYLTGVGSGESRREAEDNARAEIAKIFVSHVKSSTKVSQEYLEIIRQGKTSETSRTDVSDKIEVSTQKVLAGVRIAEVYRQTQPKMLFYALAVMDRQQTMTTLQEKLGRLDREIEGLMTQASHEKKALRKIKILTNAMETYLQRQACEAELTIVDPSGRGLTASIGLDEIKRPLTDILSQKFRVHVSISGDRANEIRRALSQGLTKEGFVLTGNAKEAQVTVKGNVSIQPLDHPDKQWTYMRWQTDFEMIDLSDRSVFGTLNNNGREGHLTREQAVNRCVMKIQNELLPIVSKDIYSYIFGKSK